VSTCCAGGCGVVSETDGEAGRRHAGPSVTCAMSVNPDAPSVPLATAARATSDGRADALAESLAALAVSRCRRSGADVFWLRNVLAAHLCVGVYAPAAADATATRLPHHPLVLHAFLPAGLRTTWALQVLHQIAAAADQDCTAAAAAAAAAAAVDGSGAGAAPRGTSGSNAPSTPILTGTSGTVPVAGGGGGGGGGSNPRRERPSTSSVVLPPSASGDDVSLRSPTNEGAAEALLADVRASVDALDGADGDPMPVGHVPGATRLPSARSTPRSISPAALMPLPLESASQATAHSLSPSHPGGRSNATALLGVHDPSPSRYSAATAPQPLSAAAPSWQPSHSAGSTTPADSGASSPPPPPPPPPPPSSSSPAGAGDAPTPLHLSPAYVNAALPQLAGPLALPRGVARVRGVWYCPAAAGRQRLMVAFPTGDVAVTVGSLHDAGYGVVVERINTVVGRDGLFKRTLLLLHAWLSLDVPAMVPAGQPPPPPHSLPSWSAAVVLLLWALVYNQSPADIATPCEGMATVWALVERLITGGFMATGLYPGVSAQSRSVQAALSTPPLSHLLSRIHPAHYPPIPVPSGASTPAEHPLPPPTPFPPALVPILAEADRMRDSKRRSRRARGRDREWAASNANDGSESSTPVPEDPPADPSGGVIGVASGEERSAPLDDDVAPGRPGGSVAATTAAPPTPAPAALNRYTVHIPSHAALAPAIMLVRAAGASGESWQLQVMDLLQPHCVAYAEDVLMDAADDGEHSVDVAVAGARGGGVVTHACRVALASLAASEEPGAAIAVGDAWMALLHATAGYITSRSAADRDAPPPPPLPPPPPPPSPSPDADAASSLPPPYTVEAELLEVVQCGAMMEQGEATAEAVALLTRQILLARGPLPVGEIGKLLQESTDNKAFSATLKVRFGGLKRFIERHPFWFTVEASHPFNPLVRMRVGDWPAALPGAEGGPDKPPDAAPPATLVTNSEVQRLASMPHHKTSLANPIPIAVGPVYNTVSVGAAAAVTPTVAAVGASAGPPYSPPPATTPARQPAASAPAAVAATAPAPVAAGSHTATSTGTSSSASAATSGRKSGHSTGACPRWMWEGGGERWGLLRAPPSLQSLPPTPPCTAQVAAQPHPRSRGHRTASQLAALPPQPLCLPAWGHRTADTAPTCHPEPRRVPQRVAWAARRTRSRVSPVTRTRPLWWAATGMA